MHEKFSTQTREPVAGGSLLRFGGRCSVSATGLRHDEACPVERGEATVHAGGSARPACAMHGTADRRRQSVALHWFAFVPRR